MKDNLFIKASVKDGKLHFPIKAMGTKYRKFFEQLQDNSKLEIFIGVSGITTINTTYTNKYF